MVHDDRWSFWPSNEKGKRLKLIKLSGGKKLIETFPHLVLPLKVLKVLHSQG